MSHLFDAPYAARDADGRFVATPEHSCSECVGAPKGGDNSYRSTTYASRTEAGRTRGRGTIRAFPPPPGQPGPIHPQGDFGSWNGASADGHQSGDRSTGVSQRSQVGTVNYTSFWGPGDLPRPRRLAPLRRFEDWPGQQYAAAPWDDPPDDGWGAPRRTGERASRQTSGRKLTDAEPRRSDGSSGQWDARFGDRKGPGRLDEALDGASDRNGDSPFDGCAYPPRPDRATRQWNGGWPRRRQRRFAVEVSQLFAGAESQSPFSELTYKEFAEILTRACRELEDQAKRDQLDGTSPVRRPIVRAHDAARAHPPGWVPWLISILIPFLVPVTNVWTQGNVVSRPVPQATVLVRDSDESNPELDVSRDLIDHLLANLPREFIDQLGNADDMRNLAMALSQLYPNLQNDLIQMIAAEMKNRGTGTDCQ